MHIRAPAVTRVQLTPLRPFLVQNVAYKVSESAFIYIYKGMLTRGGKSEAKKEKGLP